ncbi:MAG: hypothetical protein KDJ40_10120, partial [Hyphomicrobiales bacterium]|nr:hypothetical protein [Hyphomicrobiales bacterium]
MLERRAEFRSQATMGHEDHANHQILPFIRRRRSPRREIGAQTIRNWLIVFLRPGSLRLRRGKDDPVCLHRARSIAPVTIASRTDARIRDHAERRAAILCVATRLA